MNYSTNITLNQLLCDSWKSYIDKDILQNTNNLLSLEINKCKETFFEIYPFKQSDIFKIFNLTYLDNIKVVIIGQDPYHSNKFQANGIAFSVNNGVTIPPSLKNIYKEVNSKEKNINGDLSNWVKQGVFMLNASLTVKQKHPNSHCLIWDQFTSHIIDLISTHTNNVIFVGWGAYAINKLKNIDTTKHILLTSSHPSPLSCYKTDKPFFGSNIFININEILKKNNKTPILW